MKRTVKYTVLFAISLLLMLSFTKVKAQAADDRKISISVSKVTMYVGDYYLIELNNVLTEEKVTWKSSDKKIATVNSGGMITAVKAGKTTITGTCNGKKYKCTVTVKKKTAASQTTYRGADMVESGDYVFYTDTTGMWQDANGKTDRNAYGYNLAGRLYRVNKDGTGRKLMVDDLVRRVTVVDGWVYYCSYWSPDWFDRHGYCELTRIKTDGTQKQIVVSTSYDVTDYCIHDGRIYCSVSKVGTLEGYGTKDIEPGIYSFSLDGKDVKKLTKFISWSPQSIYYAQGRLFFSFFNTVILQEPRPHLLCSMNTDGTGIRTVANATTLQNPVSYNMADKDGYLYFLDVNKCLERIRVDGTGSLEILTKASPRGKIAINGDWLYYSVGVGDDGDVRDGGVARFNIKTNEIESLLEGKYTFRQFFGNKILAAETYATEASNTCLVMGYTGEKWEILQDKIDYSKFFTLKGVKALPKEPPKDARMMENDTYVQFEARGFITNGSDRPGVPSFVRKSLTEVISAGTGETRKASGNVYMASTDGRTTYEIADKSIATVDKNGVVTFKKAGTTTLTITYNYNLVFTLQIIAVQSGFTEKSYTYNVGDRISLTSLMQGSWLNVYNDRPVFSDESMVYYDTGAVTFLRPGTLTISYKAAGGTYSAEFHVVQQHGVDLQAIYGDCPTINKFSYQQYFYFQILLLNDSEDYTTCISGQNGVFAPGTPAVTNSKLPTMFALTKNDYAIYDLGLIHFELSADTHCNLYVTRQEEGAPVVFETLNEADPDFWFMFEKNGTDYNIMTYEGYYLCADNGLLKLTDYRSEALKVRLVNTSDEDFNNIW